jgi:hypothetical protein
MYARIWRGTCLAIVLAATTGLVVRVGAQGAATDITLIGCITKPATPAAAGSSGFAVSDVTSVTLPREYPEGSITRTYKLDAEAAKLAPHVGHKVTIAGTLPSKPGSMPATPVDKAAPPPTPENAPVLKVTSVTMMSPTCP